MADLLKLAWLVGNPTSEAKVSRKQLLDAVHFSGRNPSKKDMQDFCGKQDAFTFEDFTRICNNVYLWFYE